ncbi:Deoxyguanosinetriphosphate triphosphohydrolase-like protein [Aquicella siphonis]|uniref:Deoxyguanosinetriphosphate triphosphohydrolase-like protein n=1 Tax=Aquicella siphonis TaxID=254247 RepID=A0A5E4PD25_9COXI|nr:HD domain-containing protein [Aquicella siphonis]VVC74789.1 Deoxyguanosinetriphosphate triphosphohydrolase-like protein [Aquicella siphonis]
MNNLFHVIKDPVHGTMQFTSIEDAWVKPFIDSPNFQRLRHIKQLGMGDFIFPGAVHTRFNHCLGCSYVASQIAHKIGLADEERQLVMIACLLHDIGHGPFSHAFEGVFHEKLIRHEDWTPFFLADYGTKEFFQHYNRQNPRYHLTEDKFRVIAEMIMHTPSTKNVLADIVSSQMDSDRLDYLLRDSHFCGVKYGEFDFRWMLHCMAIVESGDGERLGITHKGIGAVEHYLMARRLMTRNIYHSQKKLALESLLVQLLANLAENLEYHGAYADIRHTRLGKFLIAANRFNQSVENSRNADAFKREFIEQNYPSYKELCDYDVFALIKQLAEVNDGSSCCEIAVRLQRREMPKIVMLNHAELPAIENELKVFKSGRRDAMQDWQLMLIQSPHRSYSGEDDPILVVSEQGKIRPISDYSFMIKAISDRLEHVAFLAVDQKIAEDEQMKHFIKKLELVSSEFSL